MKIAPPEFEKLVADGLTMIPEELRAHIDNVQIVIEDAPNDELLEELGVPTDETLFGLYEGTPLTERTSQYSAFPDRIVIFRKPLLEAIDAPRFHQQWLPDVTYVENFALSPDARKLLGEPSRPRPAYDENKTVNGTIYAFPDPTNKYKELELDFDLQTGTLRTVFVYPPRLSWQQCRRQWSGPVAAADAGRGRKFYSYTNRRLDVLVDPAGEVISLGWH